MTDHVQTIITIALGIIALGGFMWRKLTPITRLTEQLHGDPGDRDRGIAARPGILERQTRTEIRQDEFLAKLAEFQADLSIIKGQVTPNGGGSMKDIQVQTLHVVQQMSEASA